MLCRQERANRGHFHGTLKPVELNSGYTLPGGGCCGRYCCRITVLGVGNRECLARLHIEEAHMVSFFLARFIEYQGWKRPQEVI